MPPDSIYQLKITLADSHPPIWRRALVPAEVTLTDLHNVIQALMGWDDHLHEFEVSARGGSNPLTGTSRRDSRRLGPLPGPDEEVPEWLLEDGPEDESQVTLASIAPEVKSRFLYTYDMGDQWDHVILVEKILPRDPSLTYPLCLTGKRNGPVEDCGGMWGYEELLTILSDPAHPEYDERKEWLEQVYDVSTWDGDTFDLEGINDRLREVVSAK